MVLVHVGSNVCPARKSTKPKARALSAKRQAFVEAYCGVAQGNGTEAARIAGYKQPQLEGYRLMQNDAVRDAVAAKSPINALADTGAYLRDFWRETVEKGRSKPELLTPALRASELLGKATGQFLEKVELSGPGGGPIEVQPIVRLPTKDYSAERARLRREEQDE